MHIYIPIIPILWGVLIWAGIGLALYIPMDKIISKRIAKANMGMREATVKDILSRMAAHPWDALLAIMLWPYLIHVAFKKRL